MKQSDKNRVIVAEIISLASRDPQMRAKLKAAPRATLMEAGVELDPEEDVEVLENTTNLINAVLPPVALQERFKGVLEQAASRVMDLPEGMELRIVRQSPKKFFIALPAESADSPSTELTDELLEGVAGGTGSHQQSQEVSFDEIMMRQMQMHEINPGIKYPSIGVTEPNLHGLH